MRTRFLLQGIGRMRRLLSGRAVGASMLWAIGALVVLGAVGAGIALMSPSALQSKLEQEAGMRAYYNANAGLNFLNSMRDTAIAQKVNFTNFISLMGGTGNVTYTLPNGGSFYYKLGNVTSAGVNGTYRVTDLVGEVKDDSGKSVYGYVIYGAGKDISGINDYNIPKSTANGMGEYVGFSKNVLDITTTGNVYGDVYADKINLNGGSIIYGSIMQTSLTDELLLIGSRLGGEEEKVCSNSTVTIDGDVDVYATIFSRGSVDVENGDVYGDIYANGDVTISSDSKVEGNIYALGNVYIKNGDVVGSVYATGDVELERGSTVRNGDIHSQESVTIKNGYVYGAVHYKDSFSSCSYCSYESVDKNPEAPTYVFNCDLDVEIPDHEHKEPTGSFIVDWSGPSYSGKGILEAKENLDDYYAFDTFKTLGGTKLCFDLSNGGYITVFVSGTFQINSDDLYVRTSTDTDCFDSSNLISKSNIGAEAFASKVYFDYSGTGTVYFNGGGSWFGTIFATHELQMPDGSSSAIIGAYYSSDSTVDIGGSVLTKYVPSEYAMKHWYQ